MAKDNNKGGGLFGKIGDAIKNAPPGALIAGGILLGKLFKRRKDKKYMMKERGPLRGPGY
tara:strand:- start:74 stop:253 length:180 start_codon:yes stop_codon:yes gene_type:complete